MKLKCILVTLFSLPSILLGADSVFSLDKQHVYLVQWGRTPPRKSGVCSLIDINLEKKTCAGIDLHETLGAEIGDITLSNSGFVFCATKSALWSYDPANGKCIKVLDAPKDTQLIEIAYDPSQSIVLACCRGKDGQELFALPKNENTWIPVYNRRSMLAQVEFPVFSDKGALYFSNHGDLWAGNLLAQTEATLPALYAAGKERPKPSEKWPSVNMAELAAYRYAPVAFLETQNTTSDSTGLHALAIGRRFVYGDYSRMYGGMSWGQLIRCDLAVLDKHTEMDIPGGSKADGKQAIKALQSVETILEVNCLYLCGSRDGSLIFYYSKQKPFLIQNDGKPKPLEIKGLDEFM